ncbi:MAG: hypothetical protein E7645_06615 [Ruminococcaceae bacterium]|nr:hypothetical protein [Oscillospiraceae bacterium]
MANVKNQEKVTLSALQKKILPHITLPMQEECPTALRYALAKYDAAAVTEAYEGLFALHEEGLLEE